MRKRSEVTSTETAGAEDTRTAGPAIKKGDDGIHYVKCDECGMKNVSVGTAMKTDPPSCPRCGGEIPFTDLQVARYRQPDPKTAEEAQEPADDAAEPTKASSKPSESPAAVTTPETPAAKSAWVPTTHRADPRDVGEKVAYTWGESMYRVADFCNFKVGPFYAETTVREGETRAHALARLQRDVDGQADIMVAAKRDSYLKALRGVARAVEAVK
jgi:hypothetical protein